MVEIIDNAVQFFVTMLCLALSGVSYLKSRGQLYFILVCFYGCYALAMIYWILITILLAGTSPVFYVADILWTACYFFLYLLQKCLAQPEEQNFKCRVMWIAPLIMIPATIYYMSIGDILFDLIEGGVMFFLLWRSLRGFAYWRKQVPQENDPRYFHLAVIGFVVLENSLWISSYPWAGDTWTNLYFWIDFAVTLSLFSFFPAVRKAVKV